MKILVRILGTLVLLAIVALIIWRWRAPPWQGQELRVTVPVGAKFEILLVGDVGTGKQAQKDVAAAMETYCQTHPLSAIVLLGDNFYPHGVSSLQDPQWETAFHAMYNAPCLSRLPFYAALGNHDYQGNPEIQIGYRSQSPSWNMPYRFYDLRFGERLQIVVIDSNVLDVCGLRQHCTVDFLLAALKDWAPRTSIVVGHHPLLGSSLKYSATMQGKLMEKLLCTKASAYIAGHAHLLEHRHISQCNLDEFISGGGGASLYPAGVNRSNFALSKHGFLSLQVDADSLTYTFLDTQGETLYRYRAK